jgi:hypothetical protein
MCGSSLAFYWHQDNFCSAEPMSLCTARHILVKDNKEGQKISMRLKKLTAASYLLWSGARSGRMVGATAQHRNMHRNRA